MGTVAPHDRPIVLSLPAQAASTWPHRTALPGKFRAIVYAGVDPLTGRERRIKEIADTRDEAEVTLTRLLHQVDERMQPKSSITLGQAIEQGLDVADLEVTTRERYEGSPGMNVGQ